MTEPGTFLTILQEGGVGGGSVTPVRADRHPTRGGLPTATFKRTSYHATTRAGNRIALATIFPESFGGGAGMVAHELANHLAERYQVLLLCPGERTELTRRSNGMKVLTVASAGPDEVYYPSLGRQTASRVFDWLDEFRPDVVHSHDPVMLGALAQHWALTRAVPFFFTLHLLPDRVLEFGAGDRSILRARCLVQPVVRSYMSRFLSDCDGIIALNDAAVRSLSPYGVRARLFTISNGRDLRHFRCCRNADVTGAARNLCFIGFLSDRKNQLYLLRMLEHLPKTYRLQLVGKALTPGYERELRDYAAVHGLSNVEFLGQLDQSAIPNCLARAHAFVSASRLEVQSLTVIEALAAGTPVIGLGNETIDELVDDTVGRRLPRETPPAEFAHTVEQICSLAQPEYDRLCRCARARIERMDWTRVVDATATAYEELASGLRLQYRFSGNPAPRARGLRPLTYLYSHVNMGACALFYAYHRYRRVMPGLIGASRTPQAV